MVVGVVGFYSLSTQRHVFSFGVAGCFLDLHLDKQLICNVKNVWRNLQYEDTTLWEISDGHSPLFNVFISFQLVYQILKKQPTLWK